MTLSELGNLGEFIGSIRLEAIGKFAWRYRDS